MADDTHGKFYTQARKRATKNYQDRNLWRMSVTIPKGRREIVESYCLKHDGSINRMMNRLLREALGLTEEEWRAR